MYLKQSAHKNKPKYPNDLDEEIIVEKLDIIDKINVEVKRLGMSVNKVSKLNKKLSQSTLYHAKEKEHYRVSLKLLKSQLKLLKTL